MKMKRGLRIFVILFSVLGSAVFAQGTTIDFGPAFGGPATGHMVLTNQLAAYGVTFSTTDPEGVFWWGGDYSYEAARYSITAGNLGTVQFIDPIRVDFSIPVMQASIRGFDGGTDIDTLILKAYNSSNVLLDTDTITNIFTNPGLIASVSGANIAYITFEVSVEGNHGLFFDDLTFTEIPLPGALWLLGSGLLGLAGVRKFRKS